MAFATESSSAAGRFTNIRLDDRNPAPVRRSVGLRPNFGVSTPKNTASIPIVPRTAAEVQVFGPRAKSKQAVGHSHPFVVDCRVEGVSVAGGVSGGDAFGILPAPCSPGPPKPALLTDRSGYTPEPRLVENLPPVDPCRQIVRHAAAASGQILRLRFACAG